MDGVTEVESVLTAGFLRGIEKKQSTPVAAIAQASAAASAPISPQEPAAPQSADAVIQTSARPCEDEGATACAAEEAEAADKALNDAYKAVIARLDDQEKAALRTQQRAWIKQRDAKCSEESIVAASNGEGRGGSAVTLEIIGCTIEMTSIRTGELQRY